MKKSLFLLFILLSSSIYNIDAQVIISPDDPNIHIHGALNVKMVDGELVMHRHTDAIYASSLSTLRFNPEKAQSSTGISIKFKTSSPSVKVKMRISNVKFKKDPSGGFIGVFQHINSIPKPIHSSPAVGITPNQKQNISYTRGAPVVVDINSNNVGNIVEYKITLPIWIDLNLVSLELENGFGLVSYNKEVKPIYIAYGNSITQGRSQNGTNETYPFLLSEWMNWELYNIAVGGGKTSQKMAEMVRDEFPHIDYMTVLIGFNDYAGGSESTETYTTNYTNFLKTVREKHTNTKIYCLTLTATTYTEDIESGVKAEEFRQVVRDVVKSRIDAGDSNIVLIEGKDISTIDDLNKSVHFSVEGALRVSDRLYLEINKTLSKEAFPTESDINIYPNPSSEFINITSKYSIKKISIYSINGKKISELDYNSKNIKLNIDKLKKGLYIIKLDTNRGIYNSKINKNQ